MNSIIEEAVVPAMRRLERRIYRAEEMTSLAVPIRVDDTQFLITIHADDEAKHAIISCQLPIRVPSSRRAALALQLAQINARWLFVVFYLLDGDAMADVCVELNEVTDPEYHIGRAFLRLCAALEEEYPEIVRAVKPSRTQRPSRLERDIHEVLGELGI